MSSAATRVALRTPEHVPLTFELATVGARMAALLLDLTIVFGSVLVIAVITDAAVNGSDDPFVFVDDGDLLLTAVVQLSVFVIWNFYFILTELRWQGRTVGKRVVGLRVIARDGGPLSADLVFARNLTRDLEMLLPLVVIYNPASIGVTSHWMLIFCWLWLGIMAFMPLFNRYRARVGDLVAGTLVVHAPRETLLDDLVADQPPPAAIAAADDNPFAFTQDQLDLYGIHELQILEDVLRRYPNSIDVDLLVTIAYKIQRKIGWEAADGQTPEPYAFLRAFYSAQRGRLEHKMLFGKRQERKVR